MRYSTLLSTVVLLISNYKVTYAMSTYSYQVIQESVSLVIALACLILTINIFTTLKGGSFSTPWLFFVIGFALVAAGGIMHLMDLFKIVLHVYDLRLATLLISCGSLASLLIGLWFYRKRLE